MLVKCECYFALFSGLVVFCNLCFAGIHGYVYGFHDRYVNYLHVLFANDVWEPGEQIKELLLKSMIMV